MKVKLTALVVLSMSACVADSPETGSTSRGNQSVEPSLGGPAGGISVDLPRPADPLDKMDPVLRLAHARDRDDPTLIPLYILTSGPERVRERIEAGGGQFGATAGDVVTARVSARELASVALLPSVLEMEAAAKVKLRLERSLASTRGAEVHAGMAPLTRAYDGQGVVVAVIDAGLDLNHGSFQNADGSTRVRALWDQDGMGTAPNGFNYGSFCSGTEIGNGACNHALAATHGTHVASIAAGSRVMGQPYTGYAPGSDIVYIDVGGADDSAEAFSTNVCDGVNFAIQQAGMQPMVLNMSLGEHTGPHDGTSLASRCLDNLVRDQAGRILVAAAGNEGAGSQTFNPFDNQQAIPTRVHASGTASMQPDRIPFVPHTDANGVVQATEGDIWAAGTVNLQVRIVARDAQGNVVQSELANAGNPMVTANLAPTVGPAAIVRQMRPNGQVRFRFGIADADSDNSEAALVYAVEITGDGPWHAWIDTTSSGGFVQDQATMTRATMDNTHAIGYPGIASQVIAVASLGNRTTWPLANGGMGNADMTTVGAVSGFSSRGPSRDPSVTGQKPWIAAPGEHVVAAMSADATEAGLADLAVVGGLMVRNSYVVQEGTSMASPAAAGIIALMLQANPQLNLAGIRRILRETANTQGLTGPLPSLAAGHGRIDALAAVAAAQTATNPGPDAGVMAPDAGTAAPDGGTTGGGDGGGCSAVGGSAQNLGWTLGLLVVGMLRRRRR